MKAAMLQKHRKPRWRWLAGQALLSLAGILALTASAKADCTTLVKAPVEGGFYASQMLEFKPGFWVFSKGPLYKGTDLIQKRRLHIRRLINPERMVLGCPKTALSDSLTLGHGGFVTVGASDCFKNGKGPDILIHEPRSDVNTSETFNVYVTPDPKGAGPWYLVAKEAAVSNADNFLALELDGIRDKRGRRVEEFFWVRIEDSMSMIVPSDQHFSGFDVSAVKFLHSCHVPVG